MFNKLISVVIVLFLICGFVLTGCKDSTADPATPNAHKPNKFTEEPTETPTEEPMSGAVEGAIDIQTLVQGFLNEEYKVGDTLTLYGEVAFAYEHKNAEASNPYGEVCPVKHFIFASEDSKNFIIFFLKKEILMAVGDKVNAKGTISYTYESPGGIVDLWFDPAEVIEP